MKLGFEESQTPYTSGSQSARAWTEQWVRQQVFCPNCGSPKISAFPPNQPVADFFCPACSEEYELKSQKTKFGNKVTDGAFRTMCERLAASNNPNLLLLNYDRNLLTVKNLFVVPKHFFVREIIQKRKPLALTARRAGWVGCNILLSRIPDSGKIFFVRDGQLQPKDSVLFQWQNTLFLRDKDADARGWLIEVMKCVESIGKHEFQLEDVYAFENHLSALYPNNRHVRQKIRQQLQFLESVREHQAGLQSFRSMRRIDARRKNASALRLRFSQSLASLRQRLSQAMVRSTTQRRGNTTNPLA